MKRLFFFALLLVLVPGLLPLFGQADRATILGTVTDSSGAVLPGVEISAVNVATGVKTPGLTNEVGNYVLVNLPIGTYKVSFALPGFKTTERSDFGVTTGQKARLDVVLQVGEVTEMVTISANSELIQTDSPLVSTTMQADVINDLPLSFDGGRAVENFAYRVSPGVEGDNWTSYLSGGQAFSKEVLIDGVSATAQIQGHIGESSPTMEAVQEFKVQTSGMSAEYGRTSGGVFNFALKSGTNDFGGSLFYYGRNEALNANTWMNNWSRAKYNGDEDDYKRARDRQSLGGVSAGGPVVIPGLYNGRDKTFIFGAFEHYWRETYYLGAMDQTVPIPEFLDGNFSALLTNNKVGTDPLGRDVFAGQIYDPATLQKVGGKWVAEPFPGNIIPANRISAVSKKITDVFRQGYLPMVPGRLTNNNALTATNNPWFHQTQFTGKADHNLSDTHKLSGSFIWTQRPRILVDQGGIWNPDDPNGWGGPLAKSRKQEVTSRRLVVSDNLTFRPTLINTLTLAFNRYRNPSESTQNLDNAKNWSEELGLGNTAMSNFPEINFGDAVNGIGTTGVGYNSGSGFYVGNTYILSDHLDWITGRHNIKIGGEYWKMQMNNKSDADMTSYDFANWTTGHPGASYNKRVGFGFASFLLGEVDSSGKDVVNSQYGRRDYVALYINDDYKISPNLTVNLGLRWEQTGPLTELNGNWANFDPKAVNTDPSGWYGTISPGVPGAYVFASGPDTTFEGSRDWDGFSPRVGLAYRLSDKAVLRGGYGIFYSPMGINQWGGVPYGIWAAPDVFGTDTIPGNKATPAFKWDTAGYPGNFKPGSKDPNFLSWGVVAFDEHTLELGYTHQYNVSLQYSFGKNTMLDVSYLGNDGTRLHSGFLRRNQAKRQEYEAIPDPGAWVWDAGSAADAKVPFPYLGFSGYAGMAILPFPHVAACGGKCPWSPLIYTSSPLGASHYDALQFNLTRRMSTGLAANISYTFSKARGNTETSFDESWDYTGGIQDMYNLDEEANSVVSYDQTHILKGLAAFELPFGVGRRWLSNQGAVDAILGGWSLTTIFRYNTGNPLGINPDVWLPAWNDPENGAVYAQVASNANFDVRSPGKNFDPATPGATVNNAFQTGGFTQPAYGKLGNGKRRYDEFRGFGGAVEDLGVMKYWHFGEAAHLQFRMEMLNAFNRHRLQDPRTTISNATNFGQVISIDGNFLPRNIQMGLRLQW